MTISFHDRVVLVTGGSSGIGAATARELAAAGARVVVTGRDEAALRASAKQHERITHVVADIAKPAEAARSVAETHARFGRLDVLVNNAGIFEFAPLVEATGDHVRRTFETNVFGLVETTRAAIPLLRASKGAIVNVATAIADQPLPNASIYCASKAAVLALTRAWAQELAGDGIRVNAVSPGPIETPIFSPKKLGMTEAQVGELGQAVLAMVPLKRFGKPEEVAQVIAFLASHAASYVTGAQYQVAGGLEA
jgi:NAD(P)-dependent dehydrogenase (short-subunit alcohol dehydrogenase family)